MKRILSWLPEGMRQGIRDVFEWQGGAMDSAFMRASSEETLFNKGTRYRRPPASQGPAKVPGSDVSLTFNIGYYHRDPRVLKERAHKITMEDMSLIRAAIAGKSQSDAIEIIGGHVSGTKRLMHPDLVDHVADDDIMYDGAPGRADPDVNRYSKDGLRSAMTTSWDATDKALNKIKPDHLDNFVWQDNAQYAAEALDEVERRGKVVGGDYPISPKPVRMRNPTGMHWQYYDRIV